MMENKQTGLSRPVKIWIGVGGVVAVLVLVSVILAGVGARAYGRAWDAYHAQNVKLATTTREAETLLGVCGKNEGLTKAQPHPCQGLKEALAKVQGFTPIRHASGFGVWTGKDQVVVAQAVVDQLVAGIDQATQAAQAGLGKQAQAYRADIAPQVVAASTAAKNARAQADGLKGKLTDDGLRQAWLTKIGELDTAIKDFQGVPSTATTADIRVKFNALTAASRFAGEAGQKALAAVKAAGETQINGPHGSGSSTNSGGGYSASAGGSDYSYSSGSGSSWSAPAQGSAGSGYRAPRTSTVAPTPHSSG
ncbi:MAG: hypothetical protein MR006_05725, partial [Arcanobacterium sp.]|nr:hypothetical protein [Arcanobacterium sp.]